MCNIFQTYISPYLQYIIPIVCTSLSFLFGQWSKSEDYRRKIARERYESLYVPIFSIIINRWPGTQDVSRLPLETLEEIFNLLNNNIHFLGKKSAQYFITYQEAYFYLKNAKKGNEIFDFQRTYNDFNRIFQNMLLILLKESLGLARLTKLPPMGQSISVQGYLNHQKNDKS